MQRQPSDIAADVGRLKLAILGFQLVCRARVEGVIKNRLLDVHAARAFLKLHECADELDLIRYAAGLIRFDRLEQIGVDRLPVESDLLWQRQFLELLSSMAIGGASTSSPFLGIGGTPSGGLTLLISEAATAPHRSEFAMSRTQADSGKREGFIIFLMRFRDFWVVTSGGASSISSERSSFAPQLWQ